ncbi:MAG: VOC family protein [Longimicrobiales bacterium]
MKVSSVYPVLITDRVQDTADFYRRRFGFEDTFVSAWYVSLRHPQDPAQELAFLELGHPTIPEGFSTPSQGILINVEVDDAQSAYGALADEEVVRVVLPLRDEEFGQRHFIVVDPSGNLVDVIQNIAPSADFAGSYTEAATD